MFSLTPIRASRTDVMVLEGTRVTPEEWLLPCLTILPMGWAWSLRLCQRVVSCVVERFIPQGSMVEDKRAFVQLRDLEAVCGAAYVDSYGKGGLSPSVVDQKLSLIIEAFTQLKVSRSMKLRRPPLLHSSLA